MKSVNIQEELAKVSLDLFATQGFDRTSVQQIVDAAGVTKGALYHYFSSKDDLLADIYDRMLAMQRKHLDEIVARGLEPYETMRLICEDVIVTSIEWMREGAVFFSSYRLLPEAKQEEVRQRRREYNDVFVGVLTRGQEAGIFRSDIPQVILTANFFSNPHYLYLWQWVERGDTTKAEKLARDITELYLCGIRTPEAIKE